MMRNEYKPSWDTGQAAVLSDWRDEFLEGGAAPLQAIEDDDRQNLLDLIGQLEHGSLP